VALVFEMLASLCNALLCPSKISFQRIAIHAESTLATKD